MTVASMEANLSQREFLEWIAYFKLEPRGSRREDFNFGWIVYNMRRIMGDKSSRLKDCVLEFSGKNNPRSNSAEVNKANAAFLKMLAGRGPDKVADKKTKIVKSKKTKGG